MSLNCYSEINFHIVWHTKNNLPLLTPAIELIAHNVLKRRVMNTPRAFLHEVGGTDDHVHLAVTLPPTIRPSDWIGELKGGSAHEVNQQSVGRNKVLQWQGGYGVVSFGTKDLPWVIDYIRNQREHHAKGTVHERLEVIATTES